MKNFSDIIGDLGQEVVHDYVDQWDSCCSWLSLASVVTFVEIIWTSPSSDFILLTFIIFTEVYLSHQFGFLVLPLCACTLYIADILYIFDFLKKWFSLATIPKLAHDWSQYKLVLCTHHRSFSIDGTVCMNHNLRCWYHLAQTLRIVWWSPYQ